MSELLMSKLFLLLIECIEIPDILGKILKRYLFPAPF